MESDTNELPVLLTPKSEIITHTTTMPQEINKSVKD